MQPGDGHAGGRSCSNHSGSLVGREYAWIRVALSYAVIGTVAQVTDFENIVGIELVLHGQTPEVRGRSLGVIGHIRKCECRTERRDGCVLGGKRRKQIRCCRWYG